MRRLRTVTLNTGFDEHFDVAGVEYGSVSRIVSHRVVPSGKGVNVARLAHLLGVATVAYALVGADDELEFTGRLGDAGLSHVVRTVPGGTRRNLTLRNVQAGLPAAHMVGAGFDVAGDLSSVEALWATLLADVRAGDVVALCGSTPTGVPPSVWLDLARQLSSCGATLLVDLQGDSLVTVLAGVPVEVAKPNEDEASVLCGGSDPSPEAALRWMMECGVKEPLVTLGPQGVLHTVGGRIVRSECPVESPVVLVGAGDAFFAGYCAAVLGEVDLPPVTAGLAVAAAHVSGASAAELPSEVRRRRSGVRTEDFTSRPAPGGGSPR